MAQTYKDFEILLIDDCSDKSFQYYNSSVVHYRNSKNLGPGGSRNVGLEFARGDYIVFMDSDDYWSPTFLEKTVSIYKKQPNIIMVYSDVYTVNETENITGVMKENTKRPNSFLPHILLHGRPWCTSSCLWNKKLIMDLKWIDQRTWEDYVFDVEAAIISNEIIAVNEHLVFYDTSGSEKLSFRDGNISLIEKNRSINIIAEKIKSSDLFYIKSIRQAISKLVFNNSIALINHDINYKEGLRSNMKHLKNFLPLPLLVLIRLIITMPKKEKLSLLRKLRNLYFTKSKGQ